MQIIKLCYIDTKSFNYMYITFKCSINHCDNNNMINNEYHTVGTVSKSNRKIVEKGKINTPYMSAHFPGLAQSL